MSAQKKGTAKATKKASPAVKKNVSINGKWEMTNIRCPKCGNHVARNLDTGIVKCSYVKCGVVLKGVKATNIPAKGQKPVKQATAPTSVKKEKVTPPKPTMVYDVIPTIDMPVDKDMIDRMRKVFDITARIDDVVVPYPFKAVKDKPIQALFDAIGKGGVDERILAMRNVEVNFYDKVSRKEEIVKPSLPKATLKASPKVAPKAAPKKRK